jgi:hypothetical protein
MVIGTPFEAPFDAPAPGRLGWAPSVTDPGPSCDEACVKRHAQAMELARAPHPDAEAQRWLQADRELSTLLCAWERHLPRDSDAMDVWFANRTHHLRFPAEPLVLLEWMLIGYRESPEAETVGERRVPKERWRRPDVEALARAAVATPPSLLRVLEADPDWGLRLQPFCPAGGPVRVPDRASACLAHVGGIVGGRVLRAGAWHLLRPVGPIVPPERADALLAGLKKALRFHRVSVPDALPALRAEPEAVTHLLAQFALP